MGNSQQCDQPPTYEEATKDSYHNNEIKKSRLLSRDEHESIRILAIENTEHKLSESSSREERETLITILDQLHRNQPKPQIPKGKGLRIAGHKRPTYSLRFIG